MQFDTGFKKKPFFECLVKTSYLNRKRIKQQFIEGSLEKSPSRNFPFLPDDSRKPLKLCQSPLTERIHLKSALGVSRSVKILPTRKIGKIDSKLTQTNDEKMEGELILIPRSQQSLARRKFKVDMELSEPFKSISKNTKYSESTSVFKTKRINNVSNIKFDASVIPNINSDRTLTLSKMIKYFHYKSRLRKPFK